ncbi:uncharacterized protein LOC6531598 [Drosophila yakuba]|uniref:Uncharacterized protein n=1 Tax=Drosophila yakuba TaxID=7245 RepID=B4P7G2_DROYA|nr:uncharacterized protein LOC6531598 [Drosophila yakuba]EDW92107.1 uncharacterized protein Dyak_GE11691 [Drosophila yakuba]
MSAPETSCRRWIQKNFVPGPCRKCFESSCGPCIDYRVSTPTAADVAQLPVDGVKAVIEPDGPVRQEINIRAECSKGRPLLESDKDKLRCCTMCVAQEQNLHPNLCSAQCRPLKTYLHLNEWTKRPLPKPTYKHSIVLDNNTIVGRCFPMKFQLRRMKKNCLDCGNELYYRYPITNNSDLLLIKNCCEVEVYPAKKVDNMNNVRVTKISGVKKFANSVLKEHSECRLFTLASQMAKEKPSLMFTARGSTRKSRKSTKSRKSSRKSSLGGKTKKGSN